MAPPRPSRRHGAPRAARPDAARARSRVGALGRPVDLPSKHRLQRAGGQEQERAREAVRVQRFEVPPAREWSGRERERVERVDVRREERGEDGEQGAAWVQDRELRISMLSDILRGRELDRPCMGQRKDKRLT